MSLLTGFNISFDEVRLMGEASRAAFAGEAIPAGWDVVTPAQLGLPLQYRDGNYFTDANTGASAIVLRQGNQVIVSFRGTDDASDINQFPSLASGTYINNFQPLLSAVVNITPPGTQVYFTGASLGGGATNLMANIASSQYGGHYANAKFVAFASPNISNANGILNVGFENDPVYKGINNYGDFASSLDNLVYATPEYLAGNYDGRHPNDQYAHGSFGALETLNRVAQSIFADRMNPDSVLILDAADQLVQDITPGRENTGVFYIGETIGDEIAGRNGGDFLEGFGGNDSLNGGAGNDFLAGGTGLDTLRGSAGADAFVLDASALSEAQSGVFDRIVDYNQGNSGSFNGSEGDRLELSALLAGPYNHGNGLPVASLVRLIEDASNSFALLQIDPSGSGSWVTVARLDGIQATQEVAVVLDPSQPGGIAVRSAFSAPPPVLAISAASATKAEGTNDDGTTPFTFTVTRSGDASGTSSVSWEISATGTDPVNSSDFSGATSARLVFNPGETSKTITVNVVADRIFEANEAFVVRLADASAATIDPQQVIATGTIINDDPGVKNDFNADGTSDILWRNVNTGAVRADLIENGQYQSTAIVGQLGLEWQVQGTGDFDRDHDADILWRNVNTGAVRADLIENGQYQSTAVVGQLGVEWQLQGTGDFDRDGDADILWRNADTGTVRADLIESGQYQSTAIVGQLGLEWQVQGTGDFDGDGDADILWRSVNSGAVRADLIENGEYQSTATVGQLGLEWQVQGTGDFDRDGDADILWRNGDTGTVRADLIEDGQYQSTAIVGQLGLEWEIV